MAPFVYYTKSDPIETAITPMRPPRPRLARHLITISSPTPGQDEVFEIADDYDSSMGTTYLGIVEQGGNGEETDIDDRIWSIQTFDIVIFSLVNPGVLSQDKVSWGLVPDSYVLPLAISESVSLPMNWQDEKVGMAMGDNTGLDVGCWKVGVSVRI